MTIHDQQHLRDANGWDEYRRLVMAELERLNEVIEDLREDVKQVDHDILSLKLKASMWGAVAGTIFSALLQLIPFIVTRILGKQP